MGGSSRSGEAASDRPSGLKGAPPSSETTNPKISIFSHKNWSETDKTSSVKRGLPRSNSWGGTPDVTSFFSSAQEAMHEGSEGYRDTDKITKIKQLSAEGESREQSNSHNFLVDVWLWFVSQWWGVTLWGGVATLRFLVAFPSYLFAVLGACVRALSAPMAAAISQVEGRWVTHVYAAIEFSLLILLMMAPLFICPVLVRIVSLFI